jgi:kynurenine formamidase
MSLFQGSLTQFIEAFSTPLHFSGMLIDLTTGFHKEWIVNPSHALLDKLFGHWGTHFDCMDREFPLKYFKLAGIVFDVRSIEGRDIEVGDINISAVAERMFVGFYTGHIERFEYGKKEYFSGSPQLSHQLIDALLEKKVAIIGIDVSGIREGPEHVPADQKCADNGTFVVENLCRLGEVVGKENLVIYKSPVKIVGSTGMPCRVIAEISSKP